MKRDPHSIEQRLTREVFEHPDDDDRRLMLADFLKQQGDPKGELIDLQVRLSQLPVQHPDRVPLDFRARRLIAERGTQIAGAVAKRCGAYAFRRGLITDVTMTASSFAKYFEELLVEHPIDTLRLRPLDSASLEQLARSPALAKVRRLELQRSGAAAEVTLRPLGASAHLDSLERLNISQVETDIEDVEAAFAIVQAPRLERLEVTGAALHPRALVGLSRNPSPPPLRQLHLGGRADVDELGLALGLRALGSAPAFGILQDVALDGWRGVWAVDDWLAGPNAERLVRLRLAEGPVADEVAAALSRLKTSALEHIDLSDTYLSRTGLDALLAWHHIAGVEQLRVPLMLQRLLPIRLRKAS